MCSRFLLVGLALRLHIHRSLGARLCLELQLRRIVLVVLIEKPLLLRRTDHLVRLRVPLCRNQLRRWINDLTAGIEYRKHDDDQQWIQQQQAKHRDLRVLRHVVKTQSMEDGRDRTAEEAIENVRHPLGNEAEVLCLNLAL